jgi:hypothetical protein
MKQVREEQERDMEQWSKRLFAELIAVRMEREKNRP